MDTDLPPTDERLPVIDVFRVSLLLTGLYLATTVVASVVLAFFSGQLHPATRVFVWFAMVAAVGYSLLRRHAGRYPSHLELALILLLPIGIMMAMSMAAIATLGHFDDMSLLQLGSFLLNALILFLVGVIALATADATYSRLNRVR